MSKARGLADLGNVYDDGALSNRNLLLNGDFSVWQRGTSHSTEGYGSADRWSMHFGGTQTLVRVDMTQTRANEIKAACGHVPEHFISYNVTSFSSHSGFRTRLEDIMKVSGQTVTLTLVAASENNAVIAPKLRVWNTSAGTSQDISSTGVTTDGVMRRYTWTYDVADVFTVGSTPDGTGFFEVEIYTDRAGWHDYACVQLEQGDTATPFEHRTYGQELSLCQRYFQVFSGRRYYYASVSSEGDLHTLIYPVQMRVTPTVSTTTNSIANLFTASSVANVAGVEIYIQSSGTGVYVDWDYTLALDAEL
jgi:hypothetical protein